MPEKKLKKAPSQPFPKRKEKKSKASLFEKLNHWFENNYSGLMVFLCVLCFIFSLLLFNVRISEGGDDSAYIEAGYNYSKDFFNYHFTFNAPLYPMFLSIPIKIFGINLRLLKFLSVMFTVMHICFLFMAFSKRIPNVILYPVLFIVAANSYFLYHASQTYNEAFFLFIQAMFMYATFRLIDKIEISGSQLSKTYTDWLFFGFASFILALSKNVAILGLGALFLYFLVNRNYRNAVYTIISFLFFRIPYEIFSYFTWTKNTQYGSQFSVLMQKDAYHPEKGTEDLAGFIDRFFQNSNLYFSRRLLHILNFKSETNINLSSVETIIVTLLLLWGVFAIIKSKNKYLLITFLYAIPMIAATFVLVQTNWDQPRLILIFVPFMLLIAFFGLYYIMNYGSRMFLQFLFCAAALTLMFLSLTPSIKKAKENLPVLRKNIKGDIYYGYTPDWTNFLKMSEWCSKNLPDTAYIASRKPSMSFIYSRGKKFYPVFRLASTDADSILMELKENKVTHALIANLRKDKGKVADSTNVINTMHRLFKPVVDKYPQALKLIHKIGDKETSYLLEISYPKLPNQD